MNYVFDACALIAFFRKEEGYEVIRDILVEELHGTLIHAINLCEVFYDLVRTEGLEVANSFVLDTQLAGIEVREDMDPLLWKAAGELKASIKRISLADSFAVALTRRLDATLVTSDHAEFDKLAEQGLCKLLFLR